jgi:hypothetical protein
VFLVGSLTLTGGWPCNYWQTQAKSKRYLHGPDSDARAGAIIDGLSNVIALGENILWPSNGKVSFSCDSTTAGNWAQPYKNSISVNPGSSLGINAWWTSSCASANPPGIVIGRPASGNALSSLHPGGCHVAMADGAVKFMSQETPASLLDQMSLIADGIVPNLP